MSDMNCPFCKTDVDVHEAGRCMDAWIAKLRGYSNVHNGSARGFLTSQYYYNPDSEDIRLAKPVPKYSTDHNVFFREIVPEIWKAEKCWCINADVIGEYHFMIFINPCHANEVILEKDTNLLTAGCRAFIKMKGAEGERT